MGIHFDVEGRVATITIEGENEYNPMTPEMGLEIRNRFVEYDENPDLWVCILTGAGDGHFSAGGNLKRDQRLADQNLYTTEHVLRRWWYPKAADPISPSVAFRPDYNYRPVKPTIAAIKGYCLGAALMLVGRATDIRIAGESAKFGFTEIKRGLGGAAAVRSHLAGQIPHTTLMWMVLTAQNIDAQTALRACLVNEVVPDAQVLPRAKEVAALVCELPPNAVRAEKEALLRTENMPFTDAVVFAGALSTLNRLGHDAGEGIKAFTEKRPPRFRG